MASDEDLSKFAQDSNTSTIRKLKERQAVNTKPKTIGKPY